MKRKPKLFIAILRIATGWFLFYLGIQAMLDSSSTILPYIQHASMFPNFYAYVSQPAVALSITYIVKAALILIGAFLVIGLFVRLASILGIALMLFLYFPLLTFPYVRGGYYIVDAHVIFIILFLYFYFARAGEYFGLGTMFKVSRY